MTKPGKRHAYLVSVSQKRQAVRVYAVLAVSTGEATEIVAPAAPPRARVAIVGGLLRDLAKRLRLEPGALRLV